jgi:UDP-2,4-diacetamido-2,4,6-trideoxy-beta-L-altropyranose hydrolase
MPGTLLIRADASTPIGTGHVMRCLALAQAWRNIGGSVVFAVAEVPSGLRRRLNDAGVAITLVAGAPGSAEDAAATLAQARECDARWIVADGYHFGTSWQTQIKAAGLRLLILDDYGHAEHYAADLVLNQNAAAAPSLYARRDPDTRLLLGTAFTLLRGEFASWRGWPRATPERATRVLVTLGGADADNVTGLVLQALSSIAGLDVVVVVGAGNPHRSAIEAAAARQASAVRLAVDVSDMPERMAWADIAISAAGSTAWELAFMGLPAILIVVADNQAAIAETFARDGLGISLGTHHGLTVERIAGAVRALLDDAPGRRALSERARARVDGRGADRVVAALQPHWRIAIVSDSESWLNGAIGGLKEGWERAGHAVQWIHHPDQLESGDIAFFLSLSRVVPRPILNRHVHNLVVHESALPQGRGWSPLTWQILEGRNEIPVSLLEAADGVDSGPIYAEERLRFAGGELIEELRDAQAGATLRLCRDFVARYPFSSAEARAQAGTPSYYARRRPEDSRLDPDRSLRAQFNLLRVADPDRYPAFVELAGRRYALTLRAVDAVPAPLAAPARPPEAFAVAPLHP